MTTAVNKYGSTAYISTATIATVRYNSDSRSGDIGSGAIDEHEFDERYVGHMGSSTTPMHTSTAQHPRQQYLNLDNKNKYAQFGQDNQMRDLFRSFSLQLDRASLLEKYEDDDEIGERFVWHSCQWPQMESRSCIVGATRLRSLSLITSFTAGRAKFDSSSGSFTGEFYADDSELTNSILKALQLPVDSTDILTWIGMQVKWIIWTFASYERKYPEKYLGSLLTMQSLLQLVRQRWTAYNSRQPREITTNLGPHQACSRSFGVTSDMSPLQRCCAICTWAWPMVVCLCLSTSNNNHKSKSDINFGFGFGQTRDNNALSTTESAQITDGWWFAPVRLDAGLMDLVSKVLVRSFKCTALGMRGLLLFCPGKTTRWM
jgi:hypothetical protein